MRTPRLAEVLAIVGAGLWLAQTLVLVARGGDAPERVEAVTFVGGLIALAAAAGLAAWRSTASRGRAARAALVTLSALAVPVALFIGQVLMFAIPWSHYLESDVPVIVIGVAGLVWAVRGLRSEGSHGPPAPE